MSFRTVLAIEGVEQDLEELDVAAGLCRETGAHLSILMVAMAAPPPVGEFAAAVSAAWLEEREADMARLEEAVAAATSWLAAKGLPGDVTGGYCELAWTSDMVGRRARYCDLTVIAPESAGNGELRARAIEGALFASARPVLIVPPGGVATLQPRRVMLAWDSRVEAARAVREALAMMAKAEAVHVVMVDPEEGDLGQGAEPGADLAAYLARHGARVTVERLPSAGRPVAEVLKRHAVDLAADLMVMGGYGHSRLRERIFGGVTRSILDDAPIPVLMAR